MSNNGTPFITLFETESTRVKSISFHPTRPWLLAALHTGTIQLWDYRIKTLIDKFDEHKGPVRSVAFHPKQPLFVSGGDDDKIKVWNYKERRCLFTLSDHLDYIRTVEFHHEYPWILSASDDQTIRIWNWQSRQCVSILTGHSHYVMSAKFHPTEDLVVSASLDSTVRVWDISGLRKKNVVPMGDRAGIQLQNDLFGNTDAVVKFVLEGHEGVNWAAFHPTLPLIISGSDDRQLKLWRWSDTKAWEVDTLRAHYNSVTCCVFHPKQEIMISCAEDKSVRIWDMSKRSLSYTYRKENERFWFVASHPERNLFAAGHDSGLILFKLEKERPAMCVWQNESVFYLKDRYIRNYDFRTGKDVPIVPTKVRREANPRALQFNPAERAILMTYEESGGQWELYFFPKDSRSSDIPEAKRGAGKSAVWITRSRFAVWDVKANAILLKTLTGETSKTYPPPIAGSTIEGLFYANNGCVLLKLDNKMVLYDLQQKREVAECPCPAQIKFVSWSSSNADAYVALMSKDVLIIATSRLEILCTITERTKIKSGVWNEDSIFIYTTTSHIKYMLTNGDGGIVRTLDQPIYMTGVIGNKLFCLDREVKNRGITVDATEFLFKYALINKKYMDVLNIVKGATIFGQSIVSYLQAKGFPEVALCFVKEDQTRFDLALECGNIQKALESALRLEQADVWVRLAEAALHHGNHQIVELAYKKTNNYERLSFLYLITGQLGKLKNMEKMAEKRGDLNGVFQNALYLGDVPTRIVALEKSGQLALAYLTAKTHGLAQDAERIKSRLQSRLQEQQEGSNEPEIIDVDAKIKTSNNARILIPPMPFLKNEEGTWPLLAPARGPFDAFLNASGSQISGPAGAQAPQGQAGKSNMLATAVEIDSGDAGEGWADEDILASPQEAAAATPTKQGSEQVNEAAEEGSWDLDLQIDTELPPLPKPVASGPPPVTLPRESPHVSQLWVATSDVPVDHICAGSFDTAMKLLNTQIGVVNFAPLKPLFMLLSQSSFAQLRVPPSTSSLEVPLLRNWQTASFNNNYKEALPALSLSFNNLVEKLQAGYRAFTGGKFQEALDQFKSILHSLPLLAVSSANEVNEAKELIAIASDYILGLQMELKRKELATQPSADLQRISELAAYFTHCNLQPTHIQLTLRSAMNNAVKLKNFASAYNFGRRLLDLAPKPEVAQTTQRVLQLCEQNELKDQYQIDYDERNPFVLCAATMKPIYRGTPTVACPYCGSHYQADLKGSLCKVCELSIIGAPATGLTLMRAAPKASRPAKRSLMASNDQ